MNLKLTVLGLAAVLAIAFAVPAFGETTTVTPEVTQELSVRALAKARLALLTARSAKSQSRVAVRTAEAAMNAANKAVGPAGPPGPAGPAGPPGPPGATPPPVQSGFAAGTVSTESETFEQLPGGPSVAVDVLSSGLIEVWAQATFEEFGAVSLYEDGHQMPGQIEFQLCSNEEGEGALFTGSSFGPGEPVTVGTPGTLSPFGCGTLGPVGAVLFKTSPGPHTYELRYESLICGCPGVQPEAEFSDRSLRVAPRL
jgi:hypothetical protein